MTFIRTIPPEDATGLLKELYDYDQKGLGFVANYKVTSRDIEELRSHRLSDDEILDITAAGAARNFFSRLLDAIGAEPDQAYQEVDPEMREALTVGRPLKPKPS